jgi:hypothetical protein
LAIAFPLSIGIALVEGVILSYLVQSKGNPYLLGTGVVLALLAAVLISKAYGSLSGIPSGTSRKGFIICIVSGVLMGAFAPFNAHALIAAYPLAPYSIAVFFACCFVCNTYLMRHPLVGTPVDFGQYYRTGISQHAIGLAGGSIWGNRHGVQPSRGKPGWHLCLRRPDLPYDRRSVAWFTGVDMAGGRAFESDLFGVMRCSAHFSLVSNDIRDAHYHIRVICFSTFV